MSSNDRSSEYFELWKQIQEFKDSPLETKVQVSLNIYKKFFAHHNQQSLRKKFDSCHLKELDYRILNEISIENNLFSQIENELQIYFNNSIETVKEPTRNRRKKTIGDLDYTQLSNWKFPLSEEEKKETEQEKKLHEENLEEMTEIRQRPSFDHEHLFMKRMSMVVNPSKIPSIPLHRLSTVSENSEDESNFSESSYEDSPKIRSPLPFLAERRRSSSGISKIPQRKLSAKRQSIKLDSRFLEEIQKVKKL